MRRISLFLVISVSALLWTACSEPPVPVYTVYVAGSSNFSGNYWDACLWTDGTRQDLPKATATPDNYGPEARDVCVRDGNVWVAGYDEMVGGTMRACYWLNGTRNLLAVPDPSWDTCIYGIDYSGQDVPYLCGYQTDVMGGLYPYSWDPDGFTALDTMGLGGVAYGVCHEGTTVITGGFVYDQNVFEAPCYWVGAARTDLPRLVTAQNGGVRDVAVHDGTVYCGGMTGNADGYFVPCWWVGATRTDVTDTLYPTGRGSVEAIAVTDAGDVYLAGYCPDASGVYAPCYWRNGTCTGLSALSSDYDGKARGIAVIDDTVIVSGYTTNSAEVAVPCYWINGMRTDFTDVKNANLDSFGVRCDATVSY